MEELSNGAEASKEPIVVSEQTIEALKEQGFRVEKEDDYNKSISNLTQSEIDKAIKERDKYHYNTIDSLIEEVTGEKKPDNIKTNEYLKQYISKATSKIQDEGQAQTETEKEQQRELQAQVDALKNALQEKDSKYSEEIKQLSNRNETILKENNIKSALSAFTFDESIPKDLVDDRIEKVVNSLLNTDSKLVDGKLQFLNEDGTIKRNESNFHEPFSVEDLLKEGLSSVLTKPKPKAESSGIPSGDSKEVVSSITPPKSVTTRTQLSEWCISKGIKGAEMTKMMINYGKDLPLGLHQK